MTNRKEATAFLIKYIYKITKSNHNKKLYTDLLANMTNAQFDKFVHDIDTKKQYLSVIVPVGAKEPLSVERNLEIAKELGYDFFQQLDVHSKQPYRTPLKYMVYRLPIRRAAQLLTKKISIPTDNKSIDMTTGQVTGKSKGSKLTMPELQILAGLGLNESLVELMKIRGGDLGSSNAMTTLLYKQGSVSQNVLEQYSTGVVSKNTLRSYLLGSHLKVTL